MVETAAEKLWKASTLDEVTAVLQTLHSCPPETHSEWAAVCAAVVSCVVARGWRHCIPSPQRTLLVDNLLFSAAPPCAVACALADVAASSPLPRALAEAVSDTLRRRFLSGPKEGGGFAAALSECRDDEEFGAVLFVAASLPQRLANVLGDAGDAPLILHAALEQCVPSVRCADDARRVASLVSRAVRLGHARDVAEIFVQEFQRPSTRTETPADIGALPRALGLLLAALQDSAAEALLTSVLSFCDISAHQFAVFARECLRSDSQSSATTKELFSRRLLTTHKLPSAALSLLVEALSLLPTSLLREAAFGTISTWAEPAFARHSSGDTNSYVTEAVRMLLKAAGKEGLNKWGLLPLLLSGIQERMSSSLPRIRRLGMGVAECLSVVLDPSKPLKFDEDEEEEQEESQLDTTAPAQAPAKSESPAHKKAKESPSEVLDPDEVLSFEDLALEVESFSAPKEAGGGEEADEDDGLVPYAMEDEADAEVDAPPRPGYIRQCISALQGSRADTARAEDVVIALEATIDVLSRTPPGDADEVARSLLFELLHLRDPSCGRLPGFEPLRRTALVKAAVLSPTVAARLLSEEFYTPNRQLSDREDALSVVRDAALALSSIDRAVQTVHSEDSSAQLVPISTTRLSEDGSSRQKLPIAAGKTRRFHSIRPPQPKPLPDRFSAVAGEFFFPLMREFDKPIQTLNLLGEDSFVLASLVGTLSVVLSCSGSRHDIQHMCGTFLAFVSSIKDHPDAAVRGAVLRAVAVVVETLSSGQLRELSEELEEWRAWTKEELREDPDEQCRAAAGMVVAIVADKLRQ